jgi:hypothetical protein
MAIFEDISLTFGGDEFTIKGNQVMKLIAQIEDVISLQELTSQPKLSKLAEAYALAINYAGGKVMIDEVYASLFGDGGSENVQNSITNLIMMMIPPSNYQPDEEKSGK